MTPRYERFWETTNRLSDIEIRVILEARCDSVWYETDEYGRPIETVWPLDHYL